MQHFGCWLQLNPIEVKEEEPKGQLTLIIRDLKQYWIINSFQC